MKVLHINSYFSGSSFYKNLYDNQIDLGLNIAVFVPVTYSFDSSKFTRGNYSIISANHRKYDRLLYYIKHNKIYKDVLKNFEIEDCSIVHAHSLFSNGYIAMKLKQKLGIPYVVAVRNTDVNTFFKYMVHLRRLGIQILNEADKIVYLSEAYKSQTIEKYVPNRFKKEILRKSKVIPNGIDDFWFNNKGVAKERNHSEIKLLYVGAINKNKNILATIKAIEVLKKKGLNVTFTVVGEIEDDSIYYELSKLSYVSYLKPVKKEKLIDIYRMNDVFIMPSITETFGLVYPEAMSQGLPVIYSSGQGFDGQFPDGLVGLRVNSKSVKEIADRICDVISDYKELSWNAVNNIDNFKWTNIAKEYNNLYSEIRINQ